MKLDPKEAVNLIKDTFGGREIDPNAEPGPGLAPATTQRLRTANEGKGVPIDKMYRCQGEIPGCGLSKPANAFYKEFNTLCSECALKLVQKHSTDLYWIPLILNCYNLTRSIRDEAERGATKEGREQAYSSLVVNKEIDRGRNHFVSEMISGTKRAPMEIEWVTSLYDRYRGWIFGHYGLANNAKSQGAG
jgi:hypothetical protein